MSLVSKSLMDLSHPLFTRSDFCADVKLEDKSRDRIYCSEFFGFDFLLWCFAGSFRFLYSVPNNSAANVSRILTRFFLSIIRNTQPSCSTACTRRCWVQFIDRLQTGEVRCINAILHVLFAFRAITMYLCIPKPIPQMKQEFLYIKLMQFL